MNHCMKVIIFLLLSSLSASPQANTIKPVIPNISALKWAEAKKLPPGAKLAILTGDPKKKGFYTAWLKLPAHFTVPVHSHVANEYNTVISGTYYVGEGNRMDRNAVVALPTGSYVSFPAGVKHYGFTEEETVLEISGIGPWGTIPEKLKS